jgi:peptide chain release factor 1
MIDLTQRYEEIARRHAELEAQLGSPDLGAILAAFRERERIERQLREARGLMNDADPAMAEMARGEVEAATARRAAAEQRLHVLLLPRDPNDAKDTIVEIRAGAGGQEAALFAGDLLRMYTRYAEARRWRVELLSASESELGGFKEVIFSVEGEAVFSRMKYEGGTHRVQRVPVTEAQGRIHTSAVTVAVMPEAEEVDVAIKPEELKFDVYRSSGPGGQSVNTTDSAVRVTHLPTGLVVICQDEKSQHKNKAKALKVLRSRLYERALEARDSAISANRKAQVGSGDRSGRIRTYNFPQNRLTDHRINLTLYNLEKVLDGELDAVIDPLIEYHQTELLKGA